MYIRGSLILALAAGCSEPQVKFLHTQCARVPDSASPTAMEFTSTFRVNNLAGEQLVYRVGLLNAAARPIHSTDGRYQDAQGRVAATRALMVAEPRWTFENATVSIPWDQLELKSSEPPVVAEFAVCRADGTCLASEQVKLPLASPRRPATARKPPEERSTASADTGKSSGRAGPPRASHPRAKSPPAEEPREARRPPAITPPEKRPRDSARSADRSTSAATQPKTTPKRPAAQAGPAATLPGASAPAGKSPTGPEMQPVPTAGKGNPTTRPGRQPSTQPTGTELLGARRYVVKKGDTLAGIAERMLGGASRWPEILELNREKLKSSDNLKEGMELWIPLPSLNGETDD